MKQSKTLAIFKKQGILAAFKYQLLKKCSSLIASIAWGFNIPLPHKYQLLFVSSHYVGRYALWNFLSQCKINLNECVFESGFQAYKRNFRRILLEDSPTFGIALSESDFKGFTKYYHLLNAKVPALILVRDPISMCKSIVNLARPMWNETISAGGKINLSPYLFIVRMTKATPRHLLMWII